MNETITTARLRLRRWEQDDVELLTRLSRDPEVIRLIGDGHPWSAEHAADVSRGIVEHWTVYGFGWRVIEERDAARACGFVGLNYLGEGTAGLDPQELEIGWWLEPGAWGRGVATEAAQAVAEEAFGRVGAASVLARVQPANVASTAIARKLGMVHELDTTGRFGEAVSVYRLAAARSG